MAPILIVEPQCTGFEHAQFNAALMATLRCRDDFQTIEFWSEREHGQQVAVLLNGRSLSFDHHELGVRWSSMQWHRLAQESALCRQVFARAKNTGARIVVFASVTSLTLIALKRCLPEVTPDVRVVAYAHSVLAELERPPRRIWNRPLSIAAALGMPSPPQLRLVALSHSSAQAVAERCPGATIHVADHPYLFTPPVAAALSQAGQRSVRIGLLGAIRSKVPDLCSLITAVRERGGNVEFGMVGHLGHTASGRNEIRSLLPGAAERPIDYASYRAQLAALDYILLMPDEVRHRFAASCTLLDAFDACKPGLFLPSPLLHEYRSRIGEFGIFRDSKEALTEAILDISSRFPTEQYRNQTATLLAGRGYFEPARVASTLNRIIDN